MKTLRFIKGTFIYLSLCFLLILSCTSVKAQIQPEFSRAGYYDIDNSQRNTYSFNVGWRFTRDNVQGAESPDFDDSKWEQVNLPHGLEFVPFEASGSVNYQGPAWYRKYVTFSKDLKNKKLSLYFEAIMGKSKIFVNGHLVKQHYGGFLPAIVDITNFVELGEEALIAIWADNSDDPTFPPGKPQTTMDFSYFGGIYRDVWLVETNAIHVTDQNFVDKKAGGGIFVHYENLSKKKVNVVVDAEIVNESNKTESLTLSAELFDKTGTMVAKSSKDFKLKSGAVQSLNQTLLVNNPNLWSPDSPYLHNLIIKVTNSKGELIDGFRKRIGIRKIEFLGEKGFYLNGQKFKGKLMGGNRHQDYAYLGNALPNTTHYRDAKKLREAGMRIIRSAHYPQDPAFMDACDELGLFVIVATPGWQFWPKENVKTFENRVYSDIRQMVRQYRNNPSVIMWEPILNETHYPDYFAKNTHNIVHEEYPYQGAFTACDGKAKGSEHFDVIYGGITSGKNSKKCAYTREWGDNVDDWSSHNSPSRAAREWGERAQLTQAFHYSYPIDYTYYNYDRLHRSPEQFVGGTLWHSFDHQRGYHPDPFYGGILDAIRQPKYSYYFFMSQRPADVKLENADSGPMVYIAHEMSPFSEPNVLVFSNCDQVRLIFCEKDTLVMDADHEKYKMPNPYFYFEDVYKFMTVKGLHRAKKFEKASLIAEGIIDGKVVATHKRFPAKKVEKIVLHVDHENIDLVANGNDVVPVIASICDKDGNIKRLNNKHIQFTIEGEGIIVGNGLHGVNPVKIEWGTAPILVRSTNKAGKIKINASLVFEGKNQPLGAELVLISKPDNTKNIYNEIPKQKTIVESNAKSASDDALQRRIRELEKKLVEMGLKEVEKQQGDFDTGIDN